MFGQVGYITVMLLCQAFNHQCQVCQPTRDLQPTLSDVPFENLAVTQLVTTIDNCWKWGWRNE